MNNKTFTLSGFSRFYFSLLRFNQDMYADYALKLTYGLYLSVNDVYRHRNPDEIHTEYSENEFSVMIQKSKKQAYKTIIQLFCAMEAILYYITKKKEILKKCKLTGISEMLSMMDEMELRFYKAFDMKIDDSRTIYNVCARSLTPRRDEPGLCIMQDWIDAQKQGA